jgi:hypothetical protein
MTNQANLHSIKLLSLAIFAVIAIILCAAFPTSAQDQPNYKVGDAIEFFTTTPGTKAKFWKLKTSESIKA